MGIFAKIKEGLKKTKDKIAYGLNKRLNDGALTVDIYEALEEI